ncbi:MAG: NERD domain-containing protein [Actinobacteria bacterium]|nr:NERD domain-containing protein [Actinomycetota bacterium]
MPTKKLSLRYAGTCRSCGAALPARTTALYDPESMTVSCISCGAAATPTTPAEGRIWDGSVPGAGPQREYERRRAKRQAEVDERWGRLATMVRLMGDDPPSAMTARSGVDGERVIAVLLERHAGESLVALHGRRIPHSPAVVDHVVIAPSGVWVVDAEAHRGRVELRDTGSRRRPEHRLYVGGRDQTELITGLERRVKAVRAALEPLGLAIAPVHPVLVFVQADWGLFGKPFDIDGVHVVWAKRLIQAVTEPGPWDRSVIDAVARQLSAALPPNR